MKASRPRGHAVDCCDILRSPCCRAGGVCCFVVAASSFLAPLSTALVAWRLLPDFESSSYLPALLLLTTGVAYQEGDDWSFECIKQRCPRESLACLLDSTCRRYVRALSVGVAGNAGGGCSRDLTLAATCGVSCSHATTAYSQCLESPAGRDCAHATDGLLPVVVHHAALSGAELDLIEALAHAQRDSPGNHKNRSFGTGDNTTGHVVTWITPYIYEHASLVKRLRLLAQQSALRGGWRVPDFDGLRMRCAEVLEYGGRAASGLGWHWDVASTITMVVMLRQEQRAPVLPGDGNADNDAHGSNGELQLSTNCSVTRVVLERGDVAVYRSRHRHRVTRVTAPRTVLAVEWWRGATTQLPERPTEPSRQLLEPMASDHEEQEQPAAELQSQQAVAPVAESYDALEL